MQIPSGGVAFFDSGIGGLTVFAECRKRIKKPDFYYYGDNLRAPYGNLPFERIYTYVDEAFQTFSSLNVKAAVIACNTATAVCIERLRKKYPFPILGAEPAILPAARQGGKVLILSTCATAKSERFLCLCEKAKKEFPDVEFVVAPCSNLAQAIEKNVLDTSFSYHSFLPRETPSAVVLGCTHYIYIKNQIQSFYNCPVFDGNEGIANRLFSILSKGEKPTFDEKSRDEQPLVTTGQPPENCFLGEEKMRNLLVFKQMFVK